MESPSPASRTGAGARILRVRELPESTRTVVTLRFFDDPVAPQLQLMLYVPNGAKQPAPVFLGLNYYGNACVEKDPTVSLSDRWMRASTAEGIVSHRATEATRGAQASFWPLTLALKRGYHLRTGKHDITAYDWEQCLSFADWHPGRIR